MAEHIKGTLQVCCSLEGCSICSMQQCCGLHQSTPKILSNAVALSEEPCMRHYYDIMLRQYHAEQPPALQRKTAAYSSFGSKHQLWPEVNQACAACKCCRMAQKAECLLSAAA